MLLQGLKPTFITFYKVAYHKRLVGRSKVVAFSLYYAAKSP